MPFCPNCRGEFRASARECPFCALTLVDKYDQTPEAAPEPLLPVPPVTVLLRAAAAGAAIVETELQAAGIGTLLEPMPISAFGCGGMRVIVSKSQADAAQAFVMELIRRQPNLRLAFTDLSEIPPLVNF